MLRYLDSEGASMARSTSNRRAARPSTRPGPCSLSSFALLSLADCFRAACHPALLQDDDDIAGDDGSDGSELLSGEDLLEDNDSDCSELTEENPDATSEEELRRLEAQLAELQASELDQVCVRPVCLCPCWPLSI